MRSTVIRMMFAAVAAMSASATQAESIYISPTDTPATPGGTASVGLFMDFGSTLAVGGQVLIDLQGPISISGFTPSAYFNTLLAGFATNYGSTGNLPVDAEFQVSISTPFTLCGSVPCPSLITGQQKLGDLNFNVGAGLSALDQGIITLSEGDGFGGRGQSFAVDLTGADINMVFTGGTISAVPIPATVWLFATGMGLAGFWRRRRA